LLRCATWSADWHSVSELSAIDTFIYATLKADSTLTALIGGATTPRIYADMAPQGTPLPYIVFSNQSAVDLMGVGPGRVWTNALMWIRAIAETTSYGGTIGTLAERIDVVLQAASGSNSAGYIWACVRERPMRLTEVTDGRTYKQNGHIFRFYATKA
jgi:hypothetical protein